MITVEQLKELIQKSIKNKAILVPSLDFYNPGEPEKDTLSYICPNLLIQNITELHNSSTDNPEVYD